ncbi:MAG: hypothetical protein LBS92_02545 [Candidatus Methanoplasma sp.]|jgi:hypothetical protein|nr:hypothetical protein [Candidatus Methanoplasma sp.]
MDVKSVVDAVVALIIYIIFAVVYFVILAFVVNFSTGLVVDGDVGAPAIAVATAILTAGTIIAGGGLTDAIKKRT